MPDDDNNSSVAFVDLAGMHREVRAELDEAWRRQLDDGDYVGGAAVDRFEEEWARYCGADHAIGVANGTDALELILVAAGIGPGDEVVVPANTFIATASAVARSGAKVVFADVDPRTAVLTAATVGPVLSSRTAAVLAVHLYGNMVDIPGLLQLCEPRGIAVFEDAAQAHGARLDGRRAGSMGLAAGFSFYPSKNLGALGDGGAVTTSDAGLAERIRSLANHGRRSAAERNAHDRVGRNSRLDTLQASLLSIKLGHLDAWNAARVRAADRYRQRLPRAIVPTSITEGCEPVYHLFVVDVSQRQIVVEHLSSRKIGNGVHYPVPCHLQDAFRASAAEPLPVAERRAEMQLSLPMHPALTEVEVDRVCAVLGELSDA